MIKVDIVLDPSFQRSFKKELSKEKYQKAIQRAIPEAISKGYTVGNKAITTEYKIKTGDVKGLSEKQPKKGLIRYGGPGGSPGGKSKGRMLTTTHFGVTSKDFESQSGKAVRKRKKYYLTVKKGQKKVTRFFMLPGKPAGMLWQRTGTGRKAVRPVKGISIAQMVNKRVQVVINKTMQETYDKRFEHHVERLTKSSSGK